MKAHAAFLSILTRSWRDHPDQFSISLLKFAHGAFTRIPENSVLHHADILAASQ
jgi:hypothetical protein